MNYLLYLIFLSINFLVFLYIKRFFYKRVAIKEALFTSLVFSFIQIYYMVSKITFISYLILLPIAFITIEIIFSFINRVKL